jgi:hypothetical protein
MAAEFLQKSLNLGLGVTPSQIISDLGVWVSSLKWDLCSQRGGGVLKESID